MGIHDPTSSVEKQPARYRMVTRWLLQRLVSLGRLLLHSVEFEVPRALSSAHIALPKASEALLYASPIPYFGEAVLRSPSEAGKGRLRAAPCGGRGGME